MSRTNKSGFTIIEVVITIAIGAAIMALVLNAVQGARRAQRNTNRQADVSALTGAASQFSTNRNRLPADATALSTSDLAQFLPENKLAHYPEGNIVIEGLAGVTIGGNINGDPTASVPAELDNVGGDDNNDNVLILTQAECVAQDVVRTGLANTLINNGGVREMVIVWTLEGDPNAYCREI